MAVHPKSEIPLKQYKGKLKQTLSSNGKTYKTF
jgi:hypothetical protein